MADAAADVVGALRERVGHRPVVDDPDVVAAYRHDHAALAGAGRALAVVRASSIDEVVAVLEVASATSTPVVTRGAGTGLAGGANALDGCIVLSTAGMDRILEIDVAQRTATVQCGVLNADLAAAAARVGLWYPPDPASRAISTIGGNIATNAGGSCCLKYGVTGDHVAALRAVLADGTVIRTGATTRKNVAGFDLTRLLVGSEGALAVIVEATVRLRPAPRPPSTLVAFFPTLEATGRAVVGIEQVAEPSMLELMDRTTVGAVEAMTRMGLDTDAAALLIVQSDSPNAAEEIGRCAKACAAAGATYVAQTSDPDEGEQLLAARRGALPALERLGATLLDDIAVPKPSIPAMLDRIERIAVRHDVVVGTFGHAGDGNLHPTLVFDAADPASVATARRAFDDIVHAAIELCGTVTGEHGVGSLKIPYLDDMVGEVEHRLMARVKAAFDPHGILNPGRGIAALPRG
jgi:D-lactate dehydrogenase (cytochrome)/glycolate oxidase